MSAPGVSFTKLFEEGLLVVERGGFLSVRSGRSKSEVLKWLQEQAFGRLDKNSTSFVFFGAANTTVIEVVSADADVRYTHLALRAVSEEVFRNLKSKLDEEDSGFEHVDQGSGMPGGGPLWYCVSLGFAIRIVWRPATPQDPGVTEGSDNGQLTLEFDPERRVDEATNDSETV